MICAAFICGPGESKRYADQVLEKTEEWADLIIIYADHIDSGTQDMLLAKTIGEGAAASGCKKIVVRSMNNEPSFLDDESHVRNELLGVLDEHLTTGDLVCVLDMDEELQAAVYGQERDILKALPSQYGIEAWGVTFYHLWTPDGSVYRTDGGWRPTEGPRIYRHLPGARVQQRRMACRPIPESALPCSPSGLRVAHYGYAREPDRVAKHQRYLELDGGRYHSLAHLESIVAEPTLASYPPAA